MTLDLRHFALISVEIEELVENDKANNSPGFTS